MKNATEKKWVSLPEFPIPGRYDNAGEYLRALVQEKIGEEVKKGWSGVACRAQRLEEELDVLCQGLSENILIIKDCVDANGRQPVLRELRVHEVLEA